MSLVVKLQQAITDAQSNKLPCSLVEMIPNLDAVGF